MEQNLQQILSEQLRDVHLPEHVSWWPLAYGWWILIALTLLAFAGLIALLVQKKRNNQYRKDALAQLKKAHAQWQENKDVVVYLQGVNNTLKRAVKHVAGASNLLVVTGDDWVTGLNTLSKQALSEQTQHALAFQCYQVDAKADVALVQRDVERWVKTHQGRAAVILNGESQTSTPQSYRGDHA